MVLICIFLMTNKHLFMCLLTTSVSSLEEYPSRSFAYLKVFFFIVVLWEFSLYILDTRPLLDTWFANIFSHVLDCSFTFFIVPFEAQKF